MWKTTPCRGEQIKGGRQQNGQELQEKELALRSSAAEYLTFVASTGGSDESFEMRYEDENIWLTQRMMAALYDVDIRTINEHIKKYMTTTNCRRRQLSGISG